MKEKNKQDKTWERNKEIHNCTLCVCPSYIVTRFENYNLPRHQCLVLDILVNKSTVSGQLNTIVYTYVVWN